VLHVFLKAVRFNGTIMLRAMAWAEPTDAVYYHDLHLEYVHAPQRPNMPLVCSAAARWEHRTIAMRAVLLR
jgi:hypothetical protein